MILQVAFVKSQAYMKLSTLFNLQIQSLLLKKGFTDTINMTVSIMTIRNNGIKVLSRDRQHTLDVNCLDDNKYECDNIYVSYISEVEQPNYFFLIKFLNTDKKYETFHMKVFDYISFLLKMRKDLVYPFRI